MKKADLTIKMTLSDIRDDTDEDRLLENIHEALRSHLAKTLPPLGIDVSMILEGSVYSQSKESGPGRDEYGATEDCDCPACRALRAYKRGEEVTESMTAELKRLISEKLDQMERKRQSARSN